ncbi:plasmid recombination protein [Staphylococcus haemolyticus]|nr:plasmid recombination protein [Staphylococcus haemolyticus]
MSHSIIRIAKVKSKVNSTGIQKHIQRENENYENVDIDLEKTHMNYDLVNDDKINLNDEIEQKIAENYQGKRKIRTDAIKHVDGLITSDNEFFKDKSQDEIKAFFEHSKEFIENEYGKDNLLYATVHMDEKTPHMHFGIVPITQDGRLSAKEVIGNKKALTEFQDRFNEYVNQRGYDLERGQSRQVTNAKHDQVSRYKQKTEYHKQEYERESQKLSHIQQKNNELIEQYQKSLETLKKPLNVKYEHETEKVGGLFNKEIQKTGNVVISQEDFNAFQKQIQAAQLIKDDYEYIKSDKALNDLKNENNKLREQNKDMSETLARANEFIKDLKKHLDNALNVIKVIREIFEKLEQVLGRNKYQHLMNDVSRDNGRMIKTIQMFDKQIHPEEYQEKEQKNNQNHGRGMSR